MKVKCDKCHGNRKVKGLGFMVKICTKCGGTGYIDMEMSTEDVIDKVEVTPAPDEKAQDQRNDSLKTANTVKKRRGRPPKTKQKEGE